MVKAVVVFKIFKPPAIPENFLAILIHLRFWSFNNPLFVLSYILNEELDIKFKQAILIYKAHRMRN